MPIVAHMSPALDIRVHDYSGVILPAAILLGFTFVFFGIAVWKFQRE